MTTVLRLFCAALAASLLAVPHALAAITHLRIGMGADVTSMDPHFANIAPNNAVAWHLYDALANVDADTRLVPGLATAWRAVDDVTWEFTLRRDVRFHDGSPFDARDVEYSIKRAAALADKGGQFGGFVRAITGIEIVEPHRIRFKTATPHAVLPQDLNSIFIVSRHAGAATTEDFNAGRAAIGTGPFKLESFARGDRIVVTRNDAHRGSKSPWERVTLRLLPQDAPRVAALLAGDVDAIENVPTSDAGRIGRNARLHLERKVSWRTLFLHLDQYRENLPFDVNRDMIPIGLTAYEGLVMACSPKLGVNSLAEFIALAKKMPDKLVIGTNPAGSLPHITAKLFVDLTNTGITVVPYSTGGTADAV
jgi:peptide/nickel transport system substrate-binding protein